MSDVEEKFVKRGLEMIEKILGRNVEKGKMSEDEKEKALSRISGTTNTGDMKDCDIVIEAVTENLDLKKSIFTEVDGKLNPEAILASNTSTIPITEMASVTKRPDKFIGMHFMNPVPVMKLVEVIRGIATSDETTKTVIEIAESMDKIPIEVNDYPGFVSNRVLMPMINEAVY